MNRLLVSRPELSAIGLGLSLWVHFGAVAGRRVAPEAFFWMLHVGIFVVWFPAVFVATKRVGNAGRKDYLEAGAQGLAGMDALHGVRLLRLCDAELRHFLFPSAPRRQRRQRGKSSGSRVARLLWPLDGVLFRRAGYPVLGCRLAGQLKSSAASVDLRALSRAAFLHT